MRASQQSGVTAVDGVLGEPDYHLVDFPALLRRKGIDPAVFAKTPELTEDSLIEHHVAFVYENILSLPYAALCHGDFTKTDDVARLLHGVQHAVRVAKLIMVFANLCRRHGDAGAMELTDTTVKRSQITALFHDCGREDDKQDKWDYDSAIILYHYLTLVLGLDCKTACFYAESIANKDLKDNPAKFQIWLDEQGKFLGYSVTKFELLMQSRQDTEVEILHDGDCLDVIRARMRFMGKKLNFYHHIVSVTRSNLALEELAHLICEWRSIIEVHGDSFGRMNIGRKRFFEDKEAWERMNDMLDARVHPIVRALGNRLLSADELHQLTLLDLTPYDPLQGLTEKNLRAAMREGRAFGRSLCSPSAYSKSHPDQTMAEREFTKLFRQLGMPANARPDASTEKEGNYDRSIFMLAASAGSYGRAGMLLIDPQANKFKMVASKNMRTGYGKKEAFRSMFANSIRPTEAEIVEQLQAVLLTMKLGGDGDVSGDACRFISTHIEAICDLLCADGFYYTNDPTLYRKQACQPMQRNYKLAPLIEAIYLRKLYRLFYLRVLAETIKVYGESDGRAKFELRFGNTPDLPLFYYSGIHNVVQQIPEAELSDDYIIMYWKSLIYDYLKSQEFCIMTEYFSGILLDQIKIDAVSGNEKTKRIDVLGPADECYDDKLKSRLNEELKEMIVNSIHEIELGYCDMLRNGELTTKDEKVKITFLSAVKYGHHDVVFQLLRRDRAFCEASFAGVYPLHVAASFHRPVLVRILLEHFAHPDVEGFNNVSPLHCAVSAEDEESTRVLLNHKANPNAPDNDGITPLMIAATKGDTRIMNLLMSSRADVNRLTHDNQTALSFAINGGHVEAMSLLLLHPINLKSKQIAGSAVVAAINTGTDEVIDMLVEKGADLEKALQYAADINHFDACFHLLARGVSAAGILLNNQTSEDIVYIIYEAKRKLFSYNNYY